MIYGFTSFGFEGELVKIEVDLRRGIPACDIVGLADAAVKESRERMHSAIINSGFEFPRSRILINLSPADLKKEGTGFDLPIAVSVIIAQSAMELNTDTLVVGELELSGRLRPGFGVLAAAALAKSRGIKNIIVPVENKTEAEIPGGLCVYGVETLSEAVDVLMYPKDLQPEPPSDEYNSKNNIDIFQNAEGGDFSSVKAQPVLLRAMEIAAAGGHSLFAFGPPGCGKTMALNRFHELLPNLSRDIAVDVAKIQSLAGCRITKNLSLRPPVRKPHQSVSLEGMAGGGKQLRPGEVSLSHGGVLFIDEATAFNYTVLQVLRTPMDTGNILISRAGRNINFPANFQLIMAANPCPCGKLGVKGKYCTCTPAMVEKYWKKISQPVIDRLDLRVPVLVPEGKDFINSQGKSDLREKIKTAVEIQKYRYKNKKELYRKNSKLRPEEISSVCVMTENGKKEYSTLISSGELSPRGAASILKTSRTISDLEDEEKINSSHIQEAAFYRKWGDSPWDILEYGKYVEKNHLCIK